ncbi:uncharacterized protein LOC117116353 [Anneissia japonica]|uniref:uncharacterized protein LOC117116353 n=1 Tax=Anneissia japonica TaxID=1529436 RepID=UPI0014255056|nr:uncharacterized protein LOC117116353 [Anneissia japonica]
MEQEVKEEENTLESGLKECIDNIMAESETTEAVVALHERFRMLNMMFNDCLDYYRNRKERQQQQHSENEIQRLSELATQISIIVVIVCWLLQILQVFFITC